MAQIPTKMKALVKDGPMQSYTYREIDVPVPKEDEILVKMESVAICGSDIPLYKWDAVGQRIATIPFVPGHECSGEVVLVGSKVTEFKVGDKVCAETHIPCDKCYQCTHGVKGICKDMGLFGHGVKTLSGGCSQYATVPVSAAYKLNYKLSPRMACLLEPFGVAHNACEDIPIKGDHVLILGAGPIGLFAAALSKYMGATKVIVADIVDTRLEVATKVGADVAINTKDMSIEDILKRVHAETNGDGAGCLLECSGAPNLVNNCFKFMRKGGHAVLIGLPKAPLHIENVLGDFIFRAITVKTIHGRKMFSTWEQCEKILGEGKVNIEPIISHEYPLSQFEKAFEVLLNGTASKVIMDPQH